MAGTVIADKVQAQSTSTLEIMNGVALTPPLIEDVNGVQIGTFCQYWGTSPLRLDYQLTCGQQVEALQEPLCCRCQERS